jgi:hypothetical protein
MVFFKSCLRCSGDRSLESDQYGWYLRCLPCGHVTYPDVVGTPEGAAVRLRKSENRTMATITVLCGDGEAVGALAA